ncbi:MAG: endonuclease/exonuclease/phosphatase family protein [Anaerolineaceae bacterium]|nr:endonuclease/exonuclease/phosphatase family protein [Anaerolineaceae bacterium]
MSEITTTVNPPVARPGLVVWRRALLNLGAVVAGAYGLNVSFFLFLHYAIGEQWTIVGWFNSFMHLLVVPAVVLFPLALLLRRRVAAVLLVLPLLTFLSIYVPPFLPRPALAAPETAPQLTLLTYNLKSQAVDFDPLTRVIREADADIVALQELSTAAAAYLDTEFADEYPYRALHTLDGEPIPGQGILSRYPITSDEYWRIYLGHQRVMLDFAGQAVTLYNVHPVQPLSPGGFARRAEEFTAVFDQIRTEAGPLLIAGDFNMSDQSDLYREITALYSDTYRESATGMGFTFPAGIPQFQALTDTVVLRFFPLARLDYVFHDAAFQPLAARVWPESGGSDHHPVLVSLALVTE